MDAQHSVDHFNEHGEMVDGQQRLQKGQHGDVDWSTVQNNHARCTNLVGVLHIQAAIVGTSNRHSEDSEGARGIRSNETQKEMPAGGQIYFDSVSPTSPRRRIHHKIDIAY